MHTPFKKIPQKYWYAEVDALVICILNVIKEIIIQICPV